MTTQFLVKYSSSQAKQYGFSLVELSIIIAVFAVVITSLLSGSGIKTENSDVISVKAELDNVESALAFFQKSNGFLPCPASRTAAPSNAAYGVSVDCTNTAANPADGTINIGASGDIYQVRVGTIPTRTLGLADSAALDPWGNRLSYMIIRSLGVSSTSYSSFNPTQNTDFFQIVNKTRAVIYGSNTSEIVKYAVLSHGADGQGAFNKNGIQGLACGGSAADAENCNATKQIMVDGVSDVVQTNNSTYYNDYVRYGGATAPFPPPPIASTGAIFIATHSRGTCIITGDGKLLCTGYNDNALTGRGHHNNTILTTIFEEIIGGGKWRTVNLGYNTTACGIKDDNRIYCWGDNVYGALGNLPVGLNQFKDNPTEIDGGYNDWTALSAEDAMSCGIRDGGKLFCWGTGYYGNVASTGQELSAIPKRAADAYNNFVAVSVSDWSPLYVSICGITTDGKLYCWGDNSLGTLGDDTWVAKLEPVEVMTSHYGGIADWQNVDIGHGNVCAVRASGQLYCWGNADRGGIGYGWASPAYPNLKKPLALQGGKPTPFIALAHGNSCGASGGIAYCAGKDDYGQSTGEATWDATGYKPVVLGGAINNFRYVSPSGGNHTCGLTTNGKLYCWGINDLGQFGDGATSPLVAPPTLIALP